jgi:hypothetical protein
VRKNGFNQISGTRDEKRKSPYPLSRPGRGWILGRRASIRATSHIGKGITMEVRNIIFLSVFESSSSSPPDIYTTSGRSRVWTIAFHGSGASSAL